MSIKQTWLISKLNFTKFKNFYHLKGTNFVGEPPFVIFRKSLKTAGRFATNWKYLIDIDTYFMVLQQRACLELKSKLGSFRASSNSWTYSRLDQQLKEERAFLNHISNSSKLVNIGLYFISIRPLARKLNIKISK